MQKTFTALLVAALTALAAQPIAAHHSFAAEFDANAPLERVTLSPKRGQVTVQFVALGWVPDDRA